MTAEHNSITFELALRLGNQLDRSQFHVRLGMGHVRTSAESYYIPDVFVIPTDLVLPLRGRIDTLEAYEAPLPLVVEVWSPSTGEFDIDTELPEYQRRGDREIWRIHPFDRTLTAWTRQADGTYFETHYTQGVVRPVALPAVAIDLDSLFD